MLHLGSTCRNCHSVSKTEPLDLVGLTYCISRYSEVPCIPVVSAAGSRLFSLLQILPSLQHGVCRSSALLGLIDDVDCAVVSLSFTNDPASPVQLRHVATIPAFANVANGMPACQRPYMHLPCCSDRCTQDACRLFQEQRTWSISKACEAFADPSSIVSRPAACKLRDLGDLFSSEVH